MSHGPGRALLEQWKYIARHSGMTLEQVADFLDVLADSSKELTVASTTEDKLPTAKGPKGVQ